MRDLLGWAGRLALLAFLAAASSVGCATPTSDAPKRVWSEPVLEQMDLAGKSQAQILGYQLRQKDIAAWRATDALHAIQGFDPYGSIGWIVVPGR